MSYDSWLTTEPDREPAPGEHRPYDDACDCEECVGPICSTCGRTPDVFASCTAGAFCPFVVKPDDVKAALDAGTVERRAAERTLKRSPRR